MKNSVKHITVCICTYQRLSDLEKLLKNIAKQNTEGRFTFSVVIVDNDPSASAKDLIVKIKENYPVNLIYDYEPERSIAIARNRSLSHVEPNSDYIAFIDDDEFPNKTWLLNMFKICEANDHISGTLGPVLPHFEERVPKWLVKSGLYHRPEHSTGYVMPWAECRTGNVLMRQSIIKDLDPVFSFEFGTGGSDVDFFRRMISEKGLTFIWCNEAPVEEVVPEKRWKRRVILKRALLRGRNSLRHPKGKLMRIAKSAIAIPLYAIALPFLQLIGHHLFMRYLVKICDHLGRLAGFFGVNLVKTREM